MDVRAAGKYITTIPEKIDTAARTKKFLLTKIDRLTSRFLLFDVDSSLFTFW